MADIVREVLCRKWALEILKLLAAEGTKNYSQIEAEFTTSSDVITGRLRDLEDAGLLTRNKKSPRDVRYSITGDGERLVELVEEIYELLDE
jgi:DNA-binding HxlR family transcriptional regulator